MEIFGQLPLLRIEDSKVCKRNVSEYERRLKSFCMRLRNRRGGLPVARPQTSHVPSCRLKLGTPQVLVCVLKTHRKSREFTRRANRDRAGEIKGREGEGRIGSGRWWWREEKSTHELTRDQTRALQGLSRHCHRK